MEIRRKNKWYLFIIVGFLIFVGLFFALVGENSVLAVHDNLDLFIPQYKMMKNTGSFFTAKADIPFLGGLSRDYLPSVFNLYTLVFVILPEYPAYIDCYILKIVIAVAGAVLLAKDVFKDDYAKYEPIIYLSGFAYGIINYFPNFGIAFASIPILLFIVHRIVKKPSPACYLALFAYPFISYFSYFGIFFIGYLCVYFLFRWIKDRKFSLSLFMIIPVLSLGYAVFEYRLFKTMLFSDIVSIRATMIQASLSGKDILLAIYEGFAVGDMHTESLQLYFVMPVCLLCFLIQTVIYIKNKETKKIYTDCYNGILLFIVFNSLVYGIFNWKPFRDFLEMLLPPLKGFEFSRTQFTNPFLWYLAFFVVLKKIYDYLPRLKWAANLMILLAIGILIAGPTRYNDLFHTAYDQYHRMASGQPTNNLTYREFYSTDLFEKAKDDIDYKGEWAVAYGFYPATLEYNGISTLDGYLGYYSQDYKDEFRKIIAPALERVPESKAYFDNWGARCYTYSGNYLTNINADRVYDIDKEELYMDIDAFKNLGGRYIFARMKIINSDEVGIEQIGEYTDTNSPYRLYLYRAK